MDNDEIIEKIGINYGHFENDCRVNLEGLKKDINQMLNEARAEGYKEGQKELLKKIDEIVTRKGMHSYLQFNYEYNKLRKTILEEAKLSEKVD